MELLISYLVVGTFSVPFILSHQSDEETSVSNRYCKIRQIQRKSPREIRGCPQKIFRLNETRKYLQTPCILTFLSISKLKTRLKDIIILNTFLIYTIFLVCPSVKKSEIVKVRLNWVLLRSILELLWWSIAIEVSTKLNRRWCSIHVSTIGKQRQRTIEISMMRSSKLIGRRTNLFCQLLFNLIHCKL